MLNYYGLVFNYADLYISVADGQALPKKGVEWIPESNAPRLVIQCVKNKGGSKPHRHISLRSLLPKIDKNIAASLGGNLEILQDVFKKTITTLSKLTLRDSGILSNITGISHKVCVMLLEIYCKF